MLRGSSIKNTETAYGVTIFTGHETKVMQNAASAVHKLSTLEKKTNYSIVYVLLF